MSVSELSGDLLDPQMAPGKMVVLGHLPRLARDPLGFIASLTDVGDIVTILLGRKPIHLTTSPSLARSMLVTGGEVFRRGRIFEKATKVFGEGLIVADGEQHLRQRRLFQPAFGRQRIAGYVPAMLDAVERSCAKWQPGAVLDIPRVTHEIAVDALVHSLFKADLADEASERITAAFPGIVSGIIAHTLFPADWMERLPLGVNRRYQKSTDEIKDVVGDVIARSVGSDPADTSLLSVLTRTHNGESGPDRDLLRDEIVTMLVAGSETVATTLAWVLHEIAKHPEVEQELVSELDAELGTSAVQYGDFDRLLVTDRVIKEALRLHTPTWLLTRRTTQPTQLGQYRLPAGAEVGFSPVSLHRDARTFNSPLEFRPDRWLDDTMAGYSVGDFLPFGAGKHKCIGDTFAWAELVIALATMLKDWHLVHQPGTKVRELPMTTVQPSGLHMTAERRSSI